jgi:hypothetical protein
MLSWMMNMVSFRNMNPLTAQQEFKKSLNVNVPSLLRTAFQRRRLWVLNHPSREMMVTLIF